MYSIKTFNKIAEKGLNVFKKEQYGINDGKSPDALLLRSYNLHDEMIPSTVKAIARAGAGVNNIPVESLTEVGVVVFNTPGANANAVKELVLMSIIAASRHLVEAVNWTQTLSGKGENVPTLVEAGKKQFVGSEIYGKRLGIIGAGAIGVLVANDALALGMEVVAFDPFISVNAAWQLSREVQKAETIEEIFHTCDYITIHIPLTPKTEGLLNSETFAIMKDGVHIFNFSRGELVSEKDLEKAILAKKVASYYTDFPTDNVLHMQNVISLPHLGASTKEAEENCAYMAAQEIKNFLETGNIQNSVNFPNVKMPYIGKQRLTIIHQNIPNMVGQITGYLANHHINIANMTNRSKGSWAYTMIDMDDKIDHMLETEIQNYILSITGVKRVRVI